MPILAYRRRYFDRPRPRRFLWTVPSVAHTASPADTLALTDAVTLSFGKSVTDTVALADARVFERGKAVADSISLADARAFSFGKLVADAITLADSASPAKSKTVQIDDIVVLGPTLTLDGTEQTDASRALAVDGDGRAAESSMGFWRDSTNRLLRSSFETSLTDYTAGGTNGLARDSAQAKFGTWSAKATYADSTTLLTTAISGVTAAFKHWGTAWVWIPANWDGGQIQITTTGFTGGAEANAINADMGLTDQWQRIRVMQTPVSGDMTGNLNIIAASAPTAGRFIYIDGIQWERTNGVATPYIFTEGAIAARLGGRARLPVALIDETTGWWACKFRAGYSTAVEPAGSPRFFNWYDSDNDRLELHYNLADDRMVMRRKAAGAGSEAQIVHVTAFEDIITIVGKWTATQLGVSVNGAAFTTQANTSIPVMAQTTWQIGATGNLANAASLGEMFWAAAGTGTFTDADATSLAAVSGDPAPGDFASATGLTFLWTALTSAYNGDEFHRVIEYGRTQQDGVNLADQALDAQGLRLGDLLALTDLLTKARGISAADSVALADLLARVLAYARTISDSVSLADVATPQKSGAGALSVDDAIALTDLLSRIATANRTVTDSVSLADAQSTLLGKTVSVSDVVLLTDSLSRIVSFVRTPADSLVLTDSVLTAVPRSLLLSDLLSLDDAQSIFNGVITIMLDEIYTGRIALGTNGTNGYGEMGEISDTVAGVIEEEVTV